MAAIPYTDKRTMAQGVAAAGGGTFVVNFAVPADRLVHLNGLVALTAAAATHLTTGAHINAQCIVGNKAGVVAFTPALPGSANPDNSAGLAAGQPEASDAGFGTPTAVWTVAGANAVLTVTNPGATIADVTVILDAIAFGSQ